jgi:hypothetical protein
VSATLDDVCKKLDILISLTAFVHKVPKEVFNISGLEDDLKTLEKVVVPKEV